MSTEKKALTEKETIDFVTKPEDVTQELLKGLKEHPLFENLPVELMHKCIEAMTERKFKEKDVVIKQGDPGDHFYLVFKGTFEAHAEEAPAARQAMAVEGEQEAEAEGAESKKNELGLP